MAGVRLDHVGMDQPECVDDPRRRVVYAVIIIAAFLVGC